MKLDVVGRVEHRWRLRIELPSGVPISTATVGLMGEDGRPLGPGVVAPVSSESTVEVDVRGPCTLPPGTVARITLDVVGEEPVTHDLLVARRRGLHAWLHADSRLPLDSRAEFGDLSASGRRRLARAWCWLDDPPVETPCSGEWAAAPAVVAASPSQASRQDGGDDGLRSEGDDDMMSLLRDCGVDVDDISPEMVGQLRGR